ncbi:unnamed protein product [Polarella glacialis]|uniref:RRM domain-containing protein n=1 Tax=Polarella glacialis TaxID=89957 RepID=A0A813KK54_POLGL|nr:unnamed protein product [Polarella glacialis]
MSAVKQKVKKSSSDASASAKRMKPAEDEDSVAVDVSEMMKSLAAEASSLGGGEEWATTEAEAQTAAKAARKKRKLQAAAESSGAVAATAPASAKKSKESEAKADVPEEPLKKRKDDGLVFLSCLPFSVTEATLRTDFAKFGEITRLYFHKNSEGHAAGTASVYYKTKEDQEKVLLLDGIAYKGRIIKVKRRAPRQGAGVRTKASNAAWERWEGQAKVEK